MPIYEYACDTCETTFERKQKFDDDPIKTCPECGDDVRRVLFPAGIIFKGSGFYSTDNRGSSAANGSGTPSSNGASSNGSTSDSGSTTSSESSSSSTESTSKSESTAADV